MSSALRRYLVGSYTLAAKLVNELVEAADDKQLTQTINGFGRVDRLRSYELGYTELDKRGAEPFCSRCRPRQRKGKHGNRFQRILLRVDE
jgi:hypothetical protein